MIVSRINGYVDEDGIFCQRITFNTKSDWDMREMLRFGEDPEVTVESYDEDSVTLTRKFPL